MLRLSLFFMLVPAIELMLLLRVGARIGLLPTVALVVGTGLVGAALARSQGLGVMMRVREELAQRRLPAGSLVDGAIVLVSAALLITPGILTDVIGFLGLIPGVRAAVRAWLWKRFERAIERGDVRVETFGTRRPPELDDDRDAPPSRSRTYDADYRPLD